MQRTIGSGPKRLIGGLIAVALLLGGFGIFFDDVQAASSVTLCHGSPIRRKPPGIRTSEPTPSIRLDTGLGYNTTLPLVPPRCCSRST